MADTPECPNCRRLAAENRDLLNRVGHLSARVSALEEELRRSKRQAGPFSKNRFKGRPKRSGRKPGHPPAFRATPPSGAVAETVPVPLDTCPHCGGPVARVTDNTPIYQTDLPPIQPLIRRFDTQRGWCPRCQKAVRSRHPEQTSTATGAAGSHVGPRALALAADLTHRLGLSLRQVTDLFETTFGLRLTPGAISQASQRLARLAEPAYQALIQALRASPAVHADETGWRINGRSAWLWDFVTPWMSLYVIRRSRGHAVVEEMLGTSFPGTLVSDGLPTYDAVRVGGRQQCLAHLLRRAAALAETKTRGAVRFPRAIKRLLQRAMRLRERAPGLSPHGVAVARGRLEKALDRLLEWKKVDRDNERFAAHLANHRQHLFTFLDEAAVEPTNNLAERQLRPAVVARKRSAGNRTDGGAHAHAVLASVAATCRQRAARFTDFAVRLLREPSTATRLLLPAVPAAP
jgi:transposase